ncbi:hypothetical protein AB0B28_16505 [Glycomyces sp. NPDC046736]|uniref:hypothetical protein n=1 Tax=Glycomyces sp. NPDC046736 TaxID=3155615 RepID=UPI0033DEDEB6
MSRTVGPYKDVATARVEGAYELCEGLDSSGRPVQILTLGSSSSKDPARRGLLSDTVAWAYATAGPEDAPILVADLEAEQPYVVVLHDARLRGADRIMDRLLSLGPATGPLPVGPAAAAQRAAHQLAAAQRSAAPASPAGPSSPPPAGPGPLLSPPVVMIAAPKKRSQLKPILIGIAAVVVILALAVGLWALWTGGEDDPDAPASENGDTAAGETTELPTDGGDDAGQSDQVPQWDAEAPQERVAGELFGEGDQTQTVAYENWPFAFKVPADYTCEQQNQAVVCTEDDGDSQITVGWEACPANCSDDARKALRDELPYKPLQELGSGDIAIAERTQVYGRWRGSLSVFVTTAETTFHSWSHVDLASERGGEGWQVFNDVLNQSTAKAES